ncbi:MAG: nucleoside triphosphate pyrophosphohydrolase [Candidatus Aminicenantes bacterium]|nr:nucleoside triphosphate pyrophosphohydrolase [Candidatus Aminicenantes bacterium]
MDDEKKTGRKFSELVHILGVLRGEQGCPWDRQQDERSIADYFLEEVYEAVDAIYSDDIKALKEELGDVMMEIVFLAQIYKEKELFDISEVLEQINQKMIRRHPHVFGEKEMKTPRQVSREWNRQKRRENKKPFVFKKGDPHSPALLESYLIGKKASSFGFDWNKIQDVLGKVREELQEMEKAVESEDKDKMFEEIGDVLFAMSNLSRHFKINPEIALKKANQKFKKRFNLVEKKIRETGKDIQSANLDEMDKHWNRIKKQKE